MKTINWKSYNENDQFVRFIDLDEEMQNSIISENEEYLTWEDGQEILEDDLCSDFLLIKYASGIYSLTHKDQDLYINDIIFSES
jgi:hypothetical protein